MATYYGKLSEFDKDKEDWTSYVERLELFFEANEIEQEEKQKAILLSSCGPSTYKLFKGLTTPRKPREISFKDLIHVMKIHQEPRPNPIAERFKFNTRDRKRRVIHSLRIVKKFHQYIFGRHVTITTDHKPLLGLLSEDKAIPSMAAARIQRWAIFLSAYNYTLRYKSGLSNGNADCLSRFPADNDSETSKIENVVFLTEVDQSPIASDEVKYYTERDPVVNRVMNYIQCGWPCENLKDHFKPFKSRKDELSIEQGCVIWGNRVVIPSYLQHRVLSDLHESHPGISRMKALARSYFWWPDMDKKIEEIVSNCLDCQKHQSMPPSAPVHHWENTKNPWVRVHIDYAGPFMGKMFLIIIDSYSKWMDVFPVNNATTSVTIECLRTCFSTHGLPQMCVSDNGTCFTSDKFKHFLDMNGILHITSAPYHPATNGCAERAVRTFKSAMVKSNSKESIQTIVNRFLFAYRITPQTVTGKAPSELLMNRKLNSRLNLLKPDENCQQRKQPWIRSFNAEDKVWVRNYGKGEKWMAGKIIQKTGPISYKVSTEYGELRKHIDQVRKRTPVQPVVESMNNSINIEAPSLPAANLSDQSDSQIRPNETPIEPSSPNPISPVPSASESITMSSTTPPSTSERSRPTRERRPPKYLQDYYTHV